MLPVGSRYVAALLDDDEVAAADIEARGTPVSGSRPALVGWTNEREDLTQIKDLLQALIVATRRGDEAPRPLPRPETAYDRVERENIRSGLSEIEGKLFPAGGG